MYYLCTLILLITAVAAFAQWEDVVYINVELIVLMPMKKIMMVALFAIVAMTANAQKFALIDMEYILKNVPAYERANEQLNQVSKKWQAEVEALNTEAQTMYKNYQNEVVFLSQEQKKDKQDAIMQKEKEASDLKRKYFGPEGELFKKRESLMSPIQEEIYNTNIVWR